MMEHQPANLGDVRQTLESRRWPRSVAGCEEGWVGPRLEDARPPGRQPIYWEAWAIAVAYGLLVCNALFLLFGT